MLILLPVGVMGVVGVMAVVRDRATVEQQAQERAREVAAQLASVLSGSIASELAGFDFAAGEWYATARAGGRPQFPRVKDPEEWQAAHPEVPLEEAAPNVLYFARDGALAWPLDYDRAPKPPDWFGRLSLEQRGLWDRFRGASSAEEREAAARAFLATEPPRDAVANVNFRRGWPEGLFRDSDGRVPSESGIPLGNLRFIELVRGGWQSREVLEQAGLLFEAPSALVPEVLERGKADCAGNAAGLENVLRLEKMWRAQERLRSLGELVRRKVDWENLAATNVWLEFGGGRWLCSVRSAEAPIVTEGGKPAATNGLNAVHVYPKRLIEGAVKRSLQSTGTPGYFGLRTTLAGEPVFSAPDVGGEDDERLARVEAGLPGPEVVVRTRKAGEVQGPRGLGWVAGQPTVAVEVILRDRPLLFAQQRQRTLLFAGLIGASLVAAVVGFAAAYGSFRRQLRLSELKSNFVSSVSHELRAPIASVRLMSENLERGTVKGEAKQQEYFRFISQECRRLSSLIENVLDFSRIDQGRKEYEFEPTDLVALVRNTVKLMEPMAGERGVALKVTVPDGASAVSQAVVDGKALQQALINLADNAIKFSPSGREVRVGLEVGSGTEVRLWVEDQGVGIPKGEQERIFERFYRLGSELRRETQGVGIGLSIVRHIVDAHGGRVEVRSAPGEGSRFTVILPKG